MRKHSKGLIGRPTKYNIGVFKEIEKYLAMCGRGNMELPTVEGLALHLKINTDTIYEWSKKYKDFSDTIKKLLAKQKVQLMNDGMYGGKEINQAMAIFLLKVNHKMVEPPSSVTQINIGEMKLEYIDNESQTIEVAKPGIEG